MLTELKNKVKTSFVLHENGVNLSLLRLDLIHPILSGNKLFKLSAFLDEAANAGHQTIITFGGPYSNHLHATAWACKTAGLRCIGVVRGQESEINSQTINDCKKMGMLIHYTDRKFFRETFEHPDTTVIHNLFGDGIIIPSGGLGITGAAGASAISEYIPEKKFTHLCLPVGSATTLAGIMLTKRKEKIIAFPAIKGMHDIAERLRRMGVTNPDRLTVCNDYHFNGFARFNPELIDFMNYFYGRYKIPLDFVYTGKMMFGLLKMIELKYFDQGSDILAFHTGGLQGNRSLPEKLLQY